MSNNLCHLSKRANINVWVIKSFEKYVKIMDLCYFLKKLFGKFRKFSGIGGRSPPGPLRGRPPLGVPQTEILAAPLKRYYLQLNDITWDSWLENDWILQFFLLYYHFTLDYNPVHISFSCCEIPTFDGMCANF